MKPSLHGLVLAAGCLLQVGCGSEPRTISGGTVQAQDSGESTTGRRHPERDRPGGRSATPASESQAADPFLLAVDAAIADLMAKLREKAAAGWPAHVRLSSKEPRRPVLAISRIVNQTSRSLDMSVVEERLVAALLEGGQVTVAASAEDREQVYEEQEYGNALDSEGEAEAYEAPDATSLTLSGQLSDDIIEVDGKRKHEYSILLIVNDAVKRGTLIRAHARVVDVEDD